MRFTYVGPESAVRIFGTDFPKGVAVEVTDAHALKKLPGHPEFTGDGEPAADPPADRPKRGRKAADAD